MESEKEGNNSFSNQAKVWIRIILTCIPLIVACYLIYWAILVTQGVFIKTFSAFYAVICVVLILTSIASMALAIVALKNLKDGEYNIIQRIYFICTFLSFALCSLVLLSTSVSSQSSYESIISEYISSNPTTSESVSFSQNYVTDFDKMKYYYGLGQDTYEVILVCLTAWIAAFVSYFIV